MSTIAVSAAFNVDGEFIYKFFLDSKLHFEITKSRAVIDPKIGGRFTAWNGHISGTIIDLEKNKRIIQKWRTTDFDESDKDSSLDIQILSSKKGKSKLILKHSDLPEGTQEEYQRGWKEYYIGPLETYIEKFK